jgi:1,4-alpha-glucan branching enzyme
MGGELAQPSEWNHDGPIEWHLLNDAAHAGIRRLVGDLARLYAREPSLHELDCDPAGFEWIDANDATMSVVSFLRHGLEGEALAVVCNFTPLVRRNYRLGVPEAGVWREVLNSDATIYGGSGQGNLGGVEAVPVTFHGRPWSLVLTLPPLSALFLRPGPES